MEARAQSIEYSCRSGRDGAVQAGDYIVSLQSCYPEEHLKNDKEESTNRTHCTPVKPTQVAVVIQSPPRTKTYVIEARNLCYKIRNGSHISRSFGKGDEGFASPGVDSGKFILKNVSCEAKPGEILAIAGPSGAGKSTLLEVLAGRIRPSGQASSILINHQPMVVPIFRRISGYVPQDDALFPLLTVEETLMFSASLRLPSSVPSVEKKKRVQALMSELGLEHVAGRRIGNEETRGVSGGERRRVSIGVDVIHDPAVLLLDEPTSGLDSAAALNVVDMLESMAKSRSRTIILSIHQPSYRILQLINSILLLAHGCVVHHGPLSILHQRLLAAGHKIPAQVNVLEYAIDTVAAGSSLAVVENRQTLNVAGITLKDVLFVNCSSPKLNADIENCIAVEVKDEATNLPNGKPTFANTSAREIMVLAHRFGKNIFRTHELFAARTIQALVAGFGLGTIYINMGFTQRGVEERLGFFAFTLTFLLSATVEALPIFLEERQVLIRETSRGAYRISSYVVSNTLVFLPFLLIVAGLYSVPVYWLVGLSSTWSAFLFFVLVMWLVVLMANSFVAFLSALVPNYVLGNSIISGCMGCFFLFSGYFISKASIPSYWIFMHYLSLFKYPLDAMLINEYSSLQGKCFGLQYGDVCALTSDTVLKELGLDKESKWLNVGIMIIFICSYRVLCFLVLRFKVCKSRR